MDEELGFAPPPPYRGPPTRLERLYARVRGHRALEFLFFAIPGSGVVALAWVLDVKGVLNDPISLLLGFMGVLTAGFGFLPPIPAPVAPRRDPKSRRPPK